jgi:hypothetical protein
MRMASRVFFSYSHEDEAYRDQLEKHFAQLRRKGLIEPWHDRRILSGQPFAATIDRELDAADIVLLLVSASFLASDYCSRELARAIERHRAGSAVVIPVIVRPCEGWRDTPFGALKAAPTDGIPLTKWPNIDDAYANVAAEVRRVAEARASASAARGPRSSSQPAACATAVRARRTFSERERLQFLRAAYADVLRQLESLSRGLSLRTPQLVGEVARVDAWTARCRIRRGVTTLRECAIWLVPERGCIAYAAKRSHAFDEGICVDADTDTLFLRALSAKDSATTRLRLSPRSVADRFWALFTSALSA